MIKHGNRFIDLTGSRFGMLTVICYDQEKSTDKESAFICKCDCGNIKSISSSNLKRHCENKNCGCKINWNESTQFAKDNPRLYAIWKGMKGRCYNPNRKSFKNYGSKGIEVCDEWINSFKNFCIWALENGYSNNLTIERKENHIGYSPGNCTWATKLEQAKNKNNNIVLTHEGVTMVLSDWARHLNISYGNLLHHINSGKDIQGVIDRIKWLTKEQIAEIIKIHADGKLNNRQIGEMFGVKKDTIWWVIKRNSINASTSK